MLRPTPLLMLVLGLLCSPFAAWAQNAEGTRSALAGISFTDPPIQLPVTENFEDAMLNVATDLQRRCRTIEAYGWRLRQAEQKRVNDIFDSTALQLGAEKYKLVPRTPRSASPEVTVFTADKSDKSLLFLWSAGELGLVLLICDTNTAPSNAAVTSEKPNPGVKTPVTAKKEPKASDLPSVTPETEKPKAKTDKTAKPKDTSKTTTNGDDKAAKSKSETKSKSAKPDAKKAEPTKSGGKKAETKKTSPDKVEVKKPETKKPATKKVETISPATKKAPVKPAPKPDTSGESKSIAPEVREMLESLPELSAPMPEAEPTPKPETSLPQSQQPETPEMAPATPSESARQNSLTPPPITTAPGVLLSPDVMAPNGKSQSKPAPIAPVNPPVSQPSKLTAPEPADIKEKTDVLPPVPAVEPAPTPPITLPEAPVEMPMPPPPQ